MRTSSQRQVRNEAKFEAKNRFAINKMIAIIKSRQARKSGAKV
jgi:hypothetical protein